MDQKEFKGDNAFFTASFFLKNCSQLVAPTVSFLFCYGEVVGSNIDTSYCYSFPSLSYRSSDQYIAV